MHWLSFAGRAAAAAVVLLLATRPAAAQEEAQHRLDTLWVDIGSRASDAAPVATRGVEVISAEEIDRTPARTVADLLTIALSVDARPRSPAQTDVAVRGASFEQVLVLVDGVRASDPQTGHFDLDLAVPLEAVERIEILRGAASALYGTDAMGGVINVVTRDDAEGASVAGQAYGGSFGSAGAAATVRAGGSSVGGRLDADYRRGDGHRDGTDYEMVQTHGSLHAQLGERMLRFQFGLAARDFGAKSFYTAPDAPYDEYEETRTATARISLRSPEDDRLAIEPRLMVRRHDDDFLLQRDDPSFYRNVHTSWQTGGELVARYQATPAVRVAVGGEAYRNMLRSSSLGDRDEDRGALFAEVAAGTIGRAAVTAGLRADWHSAYETFVAPSLSGAFWPADQLRIRASTGRAFRAPTWTDRYYVSPANVGNPDLEPERSTNTELGLDLIARPTLQLSLTGFLRRGEALIDWGRPADAPETARWQATNIADAVFQGLEFEASTELLGANWTARATALSFETEDADGYDSRYVLRPLTRTLGLEVDRALPGGLHGTLRLRRARRSGESAYTRADARLAYEWGRGRIYADVNNVLDAEYNDVTQRRAPGRAVYLGIAFDPRP